MSDPKVPVVPEAKDEKIQELIQRALNAHKQFEVAPQLYVEEQRNDILTETAKKYMPEAFGTRPTKHAFWCIERELSNYSNRGYVPFIANGDMVRVNELVLTWIPIKMHRASVKAAQQRSRALMNMGLKQAAIPQNHGKVVGGDAVDVQGLTVERATSEVVSAASPVSQDDGG